MEQRQKVTASELALNERYTISPNSINSDYWFTVVEIKDDGYLVKYFDGLEGFVPRHDQYCVYLIPYSDLERELL